MTTPRWLNSLLCTRPDLRPGRALLTPTWLASLAILGVNDHLLKGAGLVPGAFTGKLSDLAGMLVAPALLAALLGLRSRRGLLLAHLAIAAVFAAIKLSPAAADAWSWLMGLVGVPWVITVDPTDLLALPALALGWRALMPAMNRPLPEFQPLSQRYAQTAAICAGTLLCVATSAPNRGDEGEGDWGEGDWGDTDSTTDIEYQEIEADVYLSNNSEQDILVRTRDLLQDVQLDCIAVAEDPGLLLTESLFGAGRTWTMPPSTNAAARDIANTPARECYAVRVEGDALSEPFILFWRADEIPVSLVVGDIDDPSQHTDGAVILAPDADGRFSVHESRRDIDFPVDLIPPADAAFPGPDVERLAWSTPPDSGTALQITALDQGPDGCIGIEFDAGKDFARWYFCLPADSFPFALDQWVDVATFASGDVVTVSRALDPQDPDTAVPAVELVASRGRILPKLADTVLAAKLDFNVDLAPDPICGTVARPNSISARYEDGPAQVVKVGETTTLAGIDSALSLWVAHAEERLVLNPVCAEGPDELGPDLEIVAVRVPQIP